MKWLIVDSDAKLSENIQRGLPEKPKWRFSQRTQDVPNSTSVDTHVLDADDSAASAESTKQFCGTREALTCRP